MCFVRNSKDRILFLICSTVYRLFSGALLIFLTWSILHQDGGSYLPLAFSIFCSFIPAFVTPMIIKRLSIRMDGRQMSSGFLVCLAGLSLVAAVCRDMAVGLLITNLLVWLIFILLEASLDMWFTQVQRGMDRATVSRFSGATTATSQAALMIGPLLAASLIPILTGIGFSILLGVSFLLVASVCYARNGAAGIVTQEGSLGRVKPAKLPLSLLIPMVLVWPILGSFNFMLPIYVSGQGWTLFELGVLDATFGMGMALIGVLIILVNTGRKLSVFLSALMALASAAAAVWFLAHDEFLLKALSLLILGMAFGGARVHIRAAIAYRYNEVAVGLFVSKSNALATPVLLLVLSMQLAIIEIAWLVPFLMITLSIALLLQTSATSFAQGR